MSGERLILCGDVQEAKRSRRDSALRLRLNGRYANVTLRIADLAKPMIGNTVPEFIDLLEIATYVYCADQIIKRGGNGVDNVGADWRRKLSFRIPVRSLDLWQSNAMRRQLVATLGFLSEDEYSFEFVATAERDSQQKYLFARDDLLQVPFEEVVLFSGGLDSLAGAIQEAIIDKRPVALVTHQPGRKLMSRQNLLRQMLVTRVAHSPLCVPVTINKKQRLEREYTQRTRSFLFMALGATVAGSLGLRRLRFYENGVVSFNLPPSRQLVGAKASRTTHPQVLEGFSRILSLVVGGRFEVENPFIWMTKGDVVDLIVRAGCADMIKVSTSCSHTWTMTKQHMHCGSCSQCISRRFAVLAAGAVEADPEDGYKTKLLDAHDESEAHTMLTSFVETANEILRMQPLDFFSRFGEASRALRHLGDSADAAAAKVYDLHRRHAQQVAAAVEQAIKENACQLRERTLPPTSLLRLVCDTAPGERPAGTSAAGPTSLGDNVFRMKGNHAWEVRFAGGRDFIVPKSKGAAYLHLLLQKPGTAFPAAKLAAAVARVPEQYMLGSAGEQADADAVAAYRARLQEIDDEIEEAASNNDLARHENLQGEKHEMEEQVKAAVGLDGRLRTQADNRERVRKAVGNAIKRTIRLIGENNKHLAAHLGKQSLTLGRNLCYEPRDPIEWQT